MHCQVSSLVSAGASATGICVEHYYCFYKSTSQELVLKDPRTKGDRRAWGWRDRGTNDVMEMDGRQMDEA